MFNKFSTRATCLPAKKIDNPIFVFDLHGVIFKLDKKQVVREFLKAPAKRNIFLACFNPYFLYTAMRWWLTTHVLEAFIVRMMDKFPIINPNRQAALQVANALKPIEETLELIKLLHSSNHEIYIFSNIGSESLAIIDEKFPEVMGMFNGVIGSTKEDNYIAKPDKKAFAKFFDKFQLDPKRVIFIDDKPENLKIAQEFSMSTVQFSQKSSVIDQIKQQISL
ncbi:MAG TPA: HAD hydrolase-like protein [Candidatus Babeliales bacterium]|nr:HAD hydrolase-like protein [Candidatus Babeliales bacterium]